MTRVLEVLNASVVVNNAKLIDDVSVSVNAGEIVAIVGANGAGKTTLLNVVGGDSNLASGAVLFGGIDHKAFSLNERARSLAILPQFSLLNFPYTVDEVVALGRTPHSSGAHVDREIVREAMLEMDIAYLSGRLYTRLSGGEKQRTQLARVMAQIWRADDARQRLMLLDEPSSSLDLAHQQGLMSAVKRFSKQGVGILMVVHDINIAATYADTIVGLCCGRTAFCGPVADVINQDNLFKLFSTNFHILKHPTTQRPVVIS